MSERRGPVMQPLASDAHLLRPVFERAETEPGRAVAAHRVGDRFVDVSAGEFATRVRRLAKGLIARGVQPGDRVALMSHTRIEWLLVDYAILAAGAVTVPAYETSSAEQLRWILEDSGAVLAVFETTAMADTFSDVAPDVPTCSSWFVIEDGGLDDLERRGDRIDDRALDARIGAITTDTTATIVYTSGTTGRPKGCELTHGNLRTNARQNLDAVGSMLGPDEVSLVFLPLAHTLTKIIALAGSEWGIKLAFATDLSHLQDELALARPTMLVGVPRVFEKVFDGAQQKAHAAGRGRIFAKAVDVAIRWSEDRIAGRNAAANRVAHAVFDRLVYRKLRAAFGGRLRFAFSGGGPLGARLTHFFHGAGVAIFEGYGLTETSPTLSVNRSDAWRPGSVGRPLAATSIRTADDGEILAKGPQLFRGYWRNADATANTFDDEGWLLTGDIGALDDDGFLWITGRKKEIIVTSGGKNVAPAPLEELLRAHPLVSQAVVIGNDRPFVAALIALEPDAVAGWAEAHDLAGAPLADLAHNPDLRAVIRTAVDRANRSVSTAESIRDFALIPNQFTVEGGDLTPTLKVRRAIVEKRYADLIKELYRRSPSASAKRPVHAPSS